VRYQLDLEPIGTLTLSAGERGPAAAEFIAVTLSRRETDSNPWSPVRENGFRDCRRLAFHARGLTMSAISDAIAANILVASFL